MRILKIITIVICLSLWPLNIYLANIQPDFVTYLIPVVLLTISFFLYKKYPGYYLIPIVFIGLFEKKLLPLPIIFCLFELLNKFNKKTLTLAAISLLLLLFNIPAYRGQTVFNKDYEAEQLILRNIHLYPNPLIARIFQNKPRIYINKVTDNFFALTDPNNYFFGFHPRPITVTNQNLFKYPFLAIIFFLYGIFYISECKNKKFIIFAFLSSLISLMVLQNFDRNDFILWLPISLVIVHGIGKLSLKNRKVFITISVLLILFALPEFLRSFIQKALMTK
jgi:hypothetical protein